MDVKNVRVDHLDAIVRFLRLWGHDVSFNAETMTLENKGIVK